MFERVIAHNNLYVKKKHYYVQIKVGGPNLSDEFNVDDIEEEKEEPEEEKFEAEEIIINLWRTSPWC